MIKKFLFAAVCICSLSFVSQAQQAFKFGTVNSQEIFMSIPETIRARRMQEVQDSQSRIESFREMASQDIQKQQEALFAPIQQKLMDAIKSVGAEGKFTYIFDLAYPIVIYQGAPSEDVTPLVKAKLGLK